MNASISSDSQIQSREIHFVIQRLIVGTNQYGLLVLVPLSVKE